MEQAIKKQNLSDREEFAQTLTEFLRRMKEKNITILSLTPDQIIFRNETGETRRIIKIGDQYIEAKEVSEKRTSSHVNLSKQQEKKKKRNIKSKKGKITSKNALKILAPLFLSTGVLVSAFSLAQENTSDTLEVKIVSEPIETLFEDDTIEEEEFSQSKDILASEETIMISQMTSVEVMPKENMVKRAETDDKYGDICDIYTSRYGIPSAIGKALLTQERPSVGDENVGQLTRNICGEKMILPIISSSEEKKFGVEKIYVVRDEPLRSSFEQESSYRQEMEKYKNQLEESKQLAKEGYQIYYFQNAMNDVELNIHLSMAYLTYCVYKCDMNVNQGIRGYNCGYPLSMHASDEEIANGKIEVGDPNYNQNVFSYLYSDEIDHLIWYLKSVPKISESQTRNMSPEEIEMKECELAASAQLIAVKMNFTQVRNLGYAQENGYTI